MSMDPVEGYPPDKQDVSQPSTDKTLSLPGIVSVALLDVNGNVLATQPVNMVLAQGDTVSFNAGAITFGVM